MNGSNRPGWSRRDFLERAGFGGVLLAARPRLIYGSPNSGTAQAACRVASPAVLAPNLQKFVALVGPGHDEFVCEKYAAELEMLLGQVGHALCVSVDATDAVGRITATDIRFRSFARPKTIPLRRTGPIRTERAEFPFDEQGGRAAFVECWKTCWSAFRSITTAELQVISLQITQQNPPAIATTIRYDIAGNRGNDLREERTGTWLVEWRQGADRSWKAVRWQAAEEMRSSLSGPGFVDITQHCLGANASYQHQLLHGVDWWRTILDSASGIDIYGNNGVAVGDIFGDGLDGFYVCQPAGLPNRLYRNRGDGTFDDITESAGLELLDGTASALFADFTNSGTQDLLVVRTGGPLLYLNHGNGKFELQPDAFHFAEAPAGTFTGVAAADYDRDGYLDVYFCLYAYYQGLSQYNHPQPYYDAQNGPPNFLLRNLGNGRFEDVTDASGMKQNNNRFSFACGWCDFDGDGWPDLYVANDFGRKNLYRNNGNGTFADIAAQAGAEDYGAGMSVSWFDYDNDGRVDLYVTDMWSAAGKRVTEQDSFLPGVDESVRKAYRKHAAGNSLLHNEGAATPFQDTSRNAHVALGRWSWSADPWDFDHDGTTDLYVTNGFVSGPQQQDLASFFWRQIVARSLDAGSGSLNYQLAWNAVNELIRADYSWNGYERNVAFLNNGDGTFTEVSALLGLDFLDDSRAFGLTDLDGDGRLEVILKNRNMPQLRILRNELRDTGRSVILRLRGTKGNRDAVGSSVTLEHGTTRQTRYLQAASGFLSQHTKELHFGIGAGSDPLSATVRWPDGATQRFVDIPADHRISLVEGEPDIHAVPYRPAIRFHEGSAGITGRETLPEHFGSWLLEPMAALPFSLPDVQGRPRSLTEFQGKPLLLMLVAGDCDPSERQLSAFAQHEAVFRQRSCALAALKVGGGDPVDTSAAALRFPVMLANDETAGAYQILYRYLFDRRGKLEPPVSFLIDESGAIVRVYAGPLDPQTAIRDLDECPRNGTDRLQKAIGFKARYHAGTPRRNYFTYGIAFVQSGHVEAALTCFHEATVREPNYAAAYYNLGTIYLNKQNLPEARTNLTKAVTLDPHDADAWTNLGSVAGQQKQYDEALDCLERAVQVNPTHLVALQNLVMLYRWQGRLDKAQAVLESAVKAQPNDAEFHFALGMLLAGQEHFEDARKELERAVALRSGDSTSLNNLGVVYLRLGRQADALNCFERCTRMSPDYDRPYLNIALVYRQAGRQSDARELLQSFAAKHPDNDEVKRALADLVQ